MFCKDTLHSNRFIQWGLSGIILSRDLTNLSVEPFIFKHLCLIIAKLFYNHQIGCCQLRSTSSHSLALKRIVDDVKNRCQKSRLRIHLLYYSWNPQVIQSASFNLKNAIKAMCINTFALVIIPEGEADPFVCLSSFGPLHRRTGLRSYEVEQIMA